MEVEAIREVAGIQHLRIKGDFKKEKSARVSGWIFGEVDPKKINIQEDFGINPPVEEKIKKQNWTERGTELWCDLSWGFWWHMGALSWDDPSGMSWVGVRGLSLYTPVLVSHRKWAALGRDVTLSEVALCSWGHTQRWLPVCWQHAWQLDGAGGGQSLPEGRSGQCITVSTTVHPVPFGITAYMFSEQLLQESMGISSLPEENLEEDSYEINCNPSHCSWFQGYSWYPTFPLLRRAQIPIHHHLVLLLVLLA